MRDESKPNGVLGPSLRIWRLGFNLGHQSKQGTINNLKNSMSWSPLPNHINLVEKITPSYYYDS